VCAKRHTDSCALIALHLVKIRVIHEAESFSESDSRSHNQEISFLSRNRKVHYDFYSHLLLVLVQS
jgi:hypothetical protein